LAGGAAWAVARWAARHFGGTGWVVVGERLVLRFAGPLAPHQALQGQRWEDVQGVVAR